MNDRRESIGLNPTMSSEVQSAPVRFASVDEAYAWLDSRIDYERILDRVVYDGQTFSIEPFRARLEAIGSPHRGRAAIHIAGSRGKGSSALFLESALRSCGLRVATFTSPHLREYRERIRIDGAPLPGADFARLLAQLANELPPAADAGSFKTVFEYLTALFFVAAREFHVDWMIVETGLGGRLDATNVLEPGPVLLTRIGLEHTRLLGSTLDAIAAEKAAILKRGGFGVAASQAATDLAPALSGAVAGLPEDAAFASPDPPGGQGGELPPAERVFNARAAEMEAPLDHADQTCPLISSEFHPRGVRLEFQFMGGPLRLDLPHLGAFLPENLQGALALLDRLAERGLIALPERAKLAEALERTRLPGRMQRIEATVGGAERREFVLDGVHCPTGAAALVRGLDLHFGRAGRAAGAIAVVGMMREKDHEAFLRTVAAWPGWRGIVCYRPDFPRALEARELGEVAARHFPAVRISETVSTALQSALDLAEKENRIVAFGTIYSLAPIQDWIAAHDAGPRAQAEATPQTEPQAGAGRP